MSDQIKEKARLLAEQLCMTLGLDHRVGDTFVFDTIVPDGGKAATIATAVEPLLRVVEAANRMRGLVEQFRDEDDPVLWDYRAALAALPKELQ